LDLFYEKTWVLRENMRLAELIAKAVASGAKSKGMNGIKPTAVVSIRRDKGNRRVRPGRDGLMATVELVTSKMDPSPRCPSAQT